VVTCEELYFNRVVTPCDSRTESLIAALRAAGTDKLLLKVDLEYPGLCDFTAPWIVKRFLTKGHFKARQKYESPLAIEWIKPILTDERGGNEVTNGLGTDAWEAGFAGVQFPSVRAVALGKDLGMPFDSDFGRQSLADWADLLASRPGRPWADRPHPNTRRERDTEEPPCLKSTSPA
jgi:hypothetical protein